jgi:hypothetical protein
MEEDIRHKLINEVSKIQFPCVRHPEEIANMFIIDESSPLKGFICGTCYTDILQS